MKVASVTRHFDSFEGATTLVHGGSVVAGDAGPFVGYTYKGRNHDVRLQ